MPLANKRYYVYVLLDGDAPFYVGKGQGKRIHHHEKEARSGCSCPKCNRIRFVWSDNRRITKIIVFESNNESEVLQRERDLIAYYGIANLCNRTTGGQIGAKREYITLDGLRRQLRDRFKREILPHKKGIDRWYWRKDMQVWVEDQVKKVLQESREPDR